VRKKIKLPIFIIPSFYPRSTTEYQNPFLAVNINMVRPGWCFRTTGICIACDEANKISVAGLFNPPFSVMAMPGIN
jgi:hypothetical protein